MTLLMLYIKQHIRFMLNFLIGALLYLAMIIYIYPTIADMDYMNELVGKMPKELIAIFNLNTGLSNLNSFVAMEYYGMIFILLMFCFSLMLVNHLYGKWIVNQSMAVLMNMPYSRTYIMIVIQLVMILFHLLLGFLMTAGGMLLVQLLTDDIKYDRQNFMHLNMLGVLLFLIIALLALMCMLLAHNIRTGLAAGAVIGFIMYALSILSKLSEDTEHFKYFTLFTLNDSAKISTGDANLLLAYSVYSGIIMLLLIMNVLLFRRKNLYL